MRNDFIKRISAMTGRKRFSLLKGLAQSLNEDIFESEINRVEREPEFVIEKNIPIESNKSSGSPLREILKELHVGDSILLDMYYYNYVSTPAKLEKIKIVRRIENNVEFRVWRVK